MEAPLDNVTVTPHVVLISEDDWSCAMPWLSTKYSAPFQGVADHLPPPLSQLSGLIENFFGT